MKKTKTRPAAPASKKSRAVPSQDKYVLRLFVAGATARSCEAIVRVRELCDAEPKGTCTLEVVDIYQQPGMARDHQIVATPTLVKEFPRPMRRFIGNLVNTSGLFVGLLIKPK